MFKTFLLLTIFLSNIYASTLKFKEEKYIGIVDQTIVKKGTLEFKKDEIQLQYENSDKILIYKNNTLTIKTSDETQEVDLNNQIALKTSFLLIEALHKNDFEMLEEFFVISNEDKIFRLEPKEALENYIEYIEFEKDKKLKYLTIFMKNGNNTTIREIND